MYISVLLRKGSFMNKLKVISFLALVAMLSACTVGNKKSVQMKKYSKEVDYETWTEKLDEATKDKDEADPEAENANDLYMDTEVSLNASSEAILNKEVLEESKQTAYGKLISRYDAETDVGTLNSDISMSITMKDEDYDITEKISAKGERQYQRSGIAEEDVLYAIDKKNQTYYIAGNDTASVQSAVTSYALMPVMVIGMLPSLYPSASDAEKAKYTFYVDGDVFTIKHVDVDEDQQSATIGGQETVYKKIKETTTMIAQIQATKKNGNVTKLLMNMEEIEEEEITYLADYDGRASGTVIKEKDDTIFSVMMYRKAVTLSAIDVTNYKLGVGDGSIEIGD